MSSVPAFVDVSGGLCNEPGSFCARQRLPCYRSVVPVSGNSQLKKARPEVTQVGATKQGARVDHFTGHHVRVVKLF